ncbi:cellulose synthase domain-containing protein [Caballeronia arationis]|uniref:Tfp pilus assembly protein PilF n=1 Tax=Caballeronia arationis TaxID=1777142 RepID=A0A7Z7I1I1_9BURK|nr:cellulose synthase subunit BcsC-related outer membrane protein [Caballeronia arationis]SAL00721.1 cellulose synthase domain-containing protein [Caballeronia arationis]SOE51557.1 Tfp pilus assembly protein PilF [Caballeronia arationis]
MHDAMKQGACSGAVAALLLAPGAGRAAGAAPPAALPADAARFFDISRMWAAKHRDDLALSQLQKALLIAPGEPVLLAEQVRILLRLGQPDAAQEILDGLRKQAPDAPETRCIEEEYRVATTGRQEIAGIRLLARSGRADEAARRLKAFFPNGAPCGPLGAEYNKILAGTESGRPQAVAALRQALSANPDDVDAALVLAVLLNERATRAEAERLAHALVGRPDVDRAVAIDAWRRVLKAASEEPSYLPSLRAYVELAPDDDQMRERLAELEAAVDAQQRLERDPAYIARQHGLAALAQGDLAGAEPLLVRAAAARPDDPDAVGGLGLLRMRTGDREAAHALFLRAAEHAPNNRGKWLALARTSELWGALASSREALANGRPDEAERAARAALRIQPKNEDARLLLANALVAQERWTEAEPLLRGLLAARQPNLSAVAPLRVVYEKTGRTAELGALFDSLQRRQMSSKDKQALAQMRAEMLVTQAERLQAHGRNGPAADHYEAALKLSPDAAWTRFALARLYRDLGSPDLGRRVMDDGLAASQAPSMRYAAALYDNSLDDARRAQALIAPVPEDERTDGMRELVRKLDVHEALESSREAATHGERERAAASLKEARDKAGGDPYLLASVGAAYIDQGAPDTGVVLLRNWLDAHPDADTDIRLRYGDLLGSARRDRELQAWVYALRERGGLNKRQLARLEDQSLRLALRQTDEALDDQDFTRARKILAAVSLTGQADRRYTLEVAELERKQGNFAAAREQLEPVLAKTPDDAEAQLTLARVLEDSGERDQALTVTRRVLLQAPPDDVDTRLGTVRRLASLHKTDEARAVTAELRQAYPERPDVTVQAGRLAQRADHFDEAASLYRTAIAQEAASGLAADRGTTPAQRALEQLDQRREPDLEAGVLFAYKSGDPGISDYHAQQVPVYGQVPIGYAGHLFAHVDTVRMDAGTLENPDVDSYTRNTFGTFAARADGTPLVASVHQHAFGVAVGAGYQSDAWRFDLGTTPLGFPVQYVVAGVRYRFETDKASVTVSASRRPETGSELSYAGARDPVTGVTWGGVRRDGIDVRGSVDIGKINVFASIGGGVLTGRNVQTNQELTMRAGVDVPVFERPDMRVSTGLVGNAWHYTNNLRFYTYGQGGYYSPQRYLALGVPLEWSGRRNAFTWDVEAVVGMSWTYERDSPYFPIGLPASSSVQGGGDNVFKGGSGGGFSYAFRGALQYRFSPKLVAGVRLSIEHSHDYVPSAAMVYVRYDFDARGRDTSLQPRPVRLYSSY